MLFTVFVAQVDFDTGQMVTETADCAVHHRLHVFFQARAVADGTVGIDVDLHMLAPVVITITSYLRREFGRVLLCQVGPAPQLARPAILQIKHPVSGGGG
jgi:hypothetical protein